MEKYHRTLNLLIFGYCSFILLLSVVTLNGTGALNGSKMLGFRSDYLLHILFFIPWMLLAKWRWNGTSGKNTFWLALALGIVFAGISEVIQIVVPYRTFNMMDWAANCLGIVVGALIAGWGRGAKRRVMGDGL